MSQRKKKYLLKKLDLKNVLFDIKTLIKKDGFKIKENFFKKSKKKKKEKKRLGRVRLAWTKWGLTQTRPRSLLAQKKKKIRRMMNI